MNELLETLATKLMLIAHDCQDIETVMELNEVIEKIVESL
jgi:hypothetical protein